MRAGRRSGLAGGRGQRDEEAAERDRGEAGGYRGGDRGRRQEEGCGSGRSGERHSSGSSSAEAAADEESGGGSSRSGSAEEEQRCCSGSKGSASYLFLLVFGPS